jgi:hypothetical protein
MSQVTAAGIYTDDQKVDKFRQVAQVLSNLPDDIKMMATEMCQTMTDIEIVMRFNQMVTSLFTFLINKTKTLSNYREYDFEVYFKLLGKSIEINTKYPIERFCLILLVFAPKIYEKDEDFFMNYNLSTQHIKITQNEFSIFESDKFKNLWKTIDSESKSRFVDDFTLLTVFAHTYFLQVILRSDKTK